MQKCVRQSSSFGAFLLFFFGLFLLFLQQVFVVVLFCFSKKQKESLSFVLRNMSISLDEHGRRMPGGSIQEEWQYQHRRQMGREVWLVWCLPCSYRPQWRKIVLSGEGQSKTQACSTPVKESKCAGLLAPSIQLAADGSMNLLHHLSQVLQYVKAAIRSETSVFPRALEIQ